MLYNDLHKFEKIIFDVLAITLVLFYSYSAVFQPAATPFHRDIFIIITYIMVFLMYRSKSRCMRIVVKTDLLPGWP